MIRATWFLLLLSAHISSAKNIDGAGSPDRYALDEDFLPENIAVYEGDNITFTCWVDTATGQPRVQWHEYASSSGGSLVSDGDFITPAHPHADRYTLLRNNQRQYDLHIRDVRRADGGTYLCTDVSAPALTKQRHSAQLIVIADAEQTCTTTIPMPPLATVEGTYYTAQCEIYYQGNIIPFMQWHGPPPFLQAQTTTNTTVWSGMSFYASRSMNTQFFTSRVNFTNNFGPLPSDSAENIPTFEAERTSDRLTVHWPPTNLYADPVKPLNEYEVGDAIECFADAFPTAGFEWQNTRTGERFLSSIFVIPSAWLGTEQAMRCNATNIINGLIYSRDHFIQVNVPTPTTPTETTTPTTTTTPPPVSSCLDLSGRWRSTGPTHAVMCIEVDSASGSIHGVLRNDTDSFWLDVVGTVDIGTYDHASFTGIWPLNRAVSAFIGECSRCDGREVLLMNAISRTKGGPPCGTPGQIHYTVQYEFERHSVPSCPPITVPT